MNLDEGRPRRSSGRHNSVTVFVQPTCVAFGATLLVHVPHDGASRMSRFVANAWLGRGALPNQWDFISLALVIAAFVAVAKGSAGMTAPSPRR